LGKRKRKIFEREKCRGKPKAMVLAEKEGSQEFRETKKKKGLTLSLPKRKKLIVDGEMEQPGNQLEKSCASLRLQRNQG